MNTPYVEENCTYTFEGKEFTSGGSYIDDNVIVAYLGENGELHNWHGEHIGSYKATAVWRTPNSYISNVMYQIHATLNDGRMYTGRSAGRGMIFRGKRTKNPYNRRYVTVR